MWTTIWHSTGCQEPLDHRQLIVREFLSIGTLTTWVKWRVTCQFWYEWYFQYVLWCNDLLFWFHLLFYQFNYIDPLTFSPLRLYLLGSHLTIYIHKYISGCWLRRHSFASYERHEVVCSHNVWPSWVLSLLNKEHCNFFPLVRVKLRQRSIATSSCCKHQDWEIKLNR